jgi:hypothetical protein
MLAARAAGGALPTVVALDVVALRAPVIVVVHVARSDANGMERINLSHERLLRLSLRKLR